MRGTNRIATPVGSVVLTALLLLAATACSPGGGPDGGGDDVLLRVADDPTVTFKVWFAVGSNDDPMGKEGLANLTGQMLSDAATEARSYEEILEALYPLASGYGARVDREMTVFSGRTHRDNLDLFLELYTDALLRPAFREEDFDRLKADALNGVRNGLRFQADEELGKAALMQLVFEGSAYAHPQMGTVAGLESITLDDVRAFYASNFTRDRARVALGGGFDDKLATRFRESVAGLPEAGSARAALPDVGRPEGNRALLVSKPGGSSSISFGFPIEVRRGEREFYALWLANSWLGEHRNSSSHLYKVIREKRGLNYGDYSYIEAFPGGGRRQVPPTHVGRSRQLFEVWIRTLPDEQAAFALRAALRELQDLVDNGMTQEEFELTREFLGKYSLHFADTTSARLGYAVDDRFYGIEGDGHLARFRKVMSELTLEEVNAAVRKHLRYEDFYLAMVTSDPEGIRDVLVSSGPSPIDYSTPKGPEILEEDGVIGSYPLRFDANAVRIVPVEEIFER